jgi:hypothetical protein
MSESPTIRGKSVLDSPKSVRSLPPVTPGVRPDGVSAYEEEKETKPSGPSDDAQDYFEGRKSSPSPLLVAATSRASVDLHRQSLKSQLEASSIQDDKTDPRTAHPNLNLSDRVISVSFVVPYNIKYGNGGNWVRMKTSFSLFG